MREPHRTDVDTTLYLKVLEVVRNTWKGKTGRTYGWGVLPDIGKTTYLKG